MESVTIALCSFLLISVCVLQIYCAALLENDEENNCTTKIIEGNNSIVEPRGKKDGGDFMKKVLPMMAAPFMMQTAMLPMTLTAMKFTLLKSMMLGQLAIILGAVTLLRNYLKRGGGLFSHNINIQSQAHHHDLKDQNYGYSGPYRNKWKTKKRRRRTIRVHLE